MEKKKKKKKKKTSAQKYTRLEECPNQLFDDMQTTLQTEEDVKCIIYARQSGSQFHTSDNS